MSKFQKRTSLVVGLSLIITFALLMHADFSRAEEIIPGVDFVTLLAGQDAEFVVTQPAAVGSHSVVVVSIGNFTLRSSFNNKTDSAIGLWWITLLGEGEETVWQFDMKVGSLYPSGSWEAEIDIDKDICFAIATAGAILFSPVSSADPYKYSIKIDTAAY